MMFFQQKVYNRLQMTENKIQKFEEQVWYIIVNNETKGPLSLRDLDVLLRTSEINSNTYVWKTGMAGWKLMVEVDEIKDSILESSKEMFEIEKKREAESKEKDKKQQGEQPKNEDQTIENKDQNVMAILQATVDNLLQKTFHQTQDGKWNIYDQEKGEWIQQQEEPTERMEKMKKDLFNKLKTELFFDQKKNFKRNKNPAKEQDDKQLTKEQLAKKEKNKKKAKRAAQKKKEKWYQAKVNTFIYIAGLPFDITEEELKQFCSKAGILRIDNSTGSEKIKIYKDQNGMPKGDAAISFAREESVQIALELLNGAEIRSGFTVKVERAQFQQKAEQYVPRETKKQSKVKKIQAKLLQNKLYGWNQDDQQTGQGLKIIIIKNVFTTDMIQNDQQIERVKQEIKTQIESFGQVKRIRYFQTHPDGVVEVKFKLEKDAETCVETLDRKSFNDQELQCDYWDGETDYKRNHVSLMLQNQRLNKFASEIEDDKKDTNNVEETDTVKQAASGQA